MNPQAVNQQISGFQAQHGIAALIVGSLFLIFTLHFLGFRFVVAAGAGVGR